MEDFIEAVFAIFFLYVLLMIFPTYIDRQECMRGRHSHYLDEPCFEMWQIFRFKSKRNPTDGTCHVNENIFWCEDKSKK